MHRLQKTLAHAVWCFVQHQQRLRAGCARGHYRGYQPTAHCQLVNPGLRHGLATRSGNDPGIGRAFDVTRHAVTKQQMQVRQSQMAQVVARLVVQPEPGGGTLVRCTVPSLENTAAS